MQKNNRRINRKKKKNILNINLNKSNACTNPALMQQYNYKIFSIMLNHEDCKEFTVCTLPLGALQWISFTEIFFYFITSFQTENLISGINGNFIKYDKIYNKKLLVWIIKDSEHLIHHIYVMPIVKEVSL